MRHRPGLALVLAACLLLAVACGSDSSPTAEGGGGQTPSVRSVDSVLTLRAAFNEDRGRTRLLLILSPT